MVVAIVAVIAAVISTRTGGTPGGKGYSRIALRRRARKFGLRPHHIRLLLNMVRELGVRDPMRLFRDQNFMTAFVRRAIRHVNSDSRLSDPEREDTKFLLFQIKRIVSMNASRTRTLGSSRRLRLGRDIRISPDGKNWYNTVVSTNLENVLGIRIPTDRQGKSLRWNKGTEVTVALTTQQSNKLYSFDTRVIGISRTRGVTHMLLAHSNDIRETQQRRYPRRESDRPVFFWPVAVVHVGTGRKQRRQAVISDSRRASGRLEDISAGGCAIRANTPLPTGNLIKIEFQGLGDHRLQAFGKVQHSERTTIRYGVMHIKFTKISRTNLNRIQEYVYGLSEEDEEYVY